MLKLYLLRHGKATKFVDDTNDFNRHLNKVGTAQINQIGYILNSTKVDIDQIIASSAVRTAETAEIVNHYLKLPKIAFNQQLYLAKHDYILHTICTTANGTSVMLVGHNNGISDLLTYLTGSYQVMSTGHLVEINFNFDTWNLVTKDSGTIVNEIVPNIQSF